MAYTNGKDSLSKYREYRDAARLTRMELAYRIGLDMCYYEGVQWIQPNRSPGGRSGLGRMKENYSPDATDLRVVDNEVTVNIQKISASTEPVRLYVDGEPPLMDTGLEGQFLARVAEEATNAAIDSSGYLQMAQDANMSATICGSWLIGLAARLRSRSVAGVPEPDWDIRAFDDDPTSLVLDPMVRDRDLSRHDCVMYETFWTYRKIREMFPKVKIEESECRSYKDLDPAKDYLNKLSGGRIFSALTRYSETKGAMVAQIHERDSSGRFPTMMVAITMPNGEEVVVNQDNPQTPFGGNGLPFQLLFGHRRSDVLWGMSDVTMMRADQDKKNLNRTLMFRIMQRYYHGRTYIDGRFFDQAGKNANPDDIRRQFTNAVNGLIIGSRGDKSRNVDPPHTEYSQPPPPFMSEEDERLVDTMRRKSHKSPGSYGETKTHVGNEQAALARDDAAEVRDSRVRGYTAAHERLMRVLFATQVKNTKEQNPTTVANLHAAGFDEDKFAALISIDEFRPQVTLKVREETFRPRSLRQKRQDLDAAANLQQITPVEARRALATDLQTPATAMDQQMADEANRAARMVLLGQPWIPRPLGFYGQFFITAFQSATFDPKATNPQVMQMLQAAIQQQTDLDTQFAMMSDPTIRAQQMQAEQQMAMQQQQAAQEQAAAAQPQEMDVATLLQQLSGGAPQPETAAA